MNLLRTRTGVEPEIISGEEEAALSFLGATEGAFRGETCGVVDIGGGSTELVIGQGAEIRLAVSCQMGAVRLFRELPIARKEDMSAVEEAAEKILREKWNTLNNVPPVPKKWIGTGGTFTALAALATGVHWTERTYMHGTRLEKGLIRGIGEKLAGMTPKERLTLEGLQPSRADIVVHGICILLAVMKHLGTETITVSEYGNLDGYLRKRYFSC
jgi:exopolyphosphatase/guanosine-5'-triphosphate,3'-diphosphate pyrophosphatase